MRVQVRFRGVEGSGDLAEYVARRVHQHLSRFGRQVGVVVLRITDVNGPKGGADKRCQLTATGPRIGSVNVAEAHDDLHAGVDGAIERLSHAIGRRLERPRRPLAAGAAGRET